MAAANGTSDGVLLSETVYYADGTRAGVKTPDDGYWTTRYIGSLIYEGEPGQETLEGIITDNGFIRWNGSAANSRMQYFLRDHLGSVRVIAEDRHTVISRTDYLPFGVRMSGDGLTAGNATARSSFFGFSGKENEMWGGYDTADGDITPHWLKGERYQHFGARAYDPVSCIFMQVDPMAEKYYGMTPYGYCAGNPVMMVDNLGSQPQSIAYEVVKTFSKKGIQHYLFLSVAPLCAPLSAVLLAGGLVVGDTPITEFSEDDTEGKTTNQDGDDVSGDGTDTEVDFPSSSDEVNSTGGTKIPDSELTPPDKRGRAPKGKDGYPIELHHRGQSQDGPLDEMTRTQHRGVGNFKKNHSNVGTEKSKINRNESNRERREYWKKYWDNGRFGNGNSDGGSH